MALGALQGPAELLPVSSSGHIALVPRLLGWPYADLPGEVRKSFEVALHAGSAPVLALAAAGAPRLDLRGVVLTFAPAAAAGLLFESEIEQRLGSTRSVAIAQIAAGAVLIAADLRSPRRTRIRRRDQLAVGLAQAAALVPGVSRSGAVISAGRLNGLDRQTASGLALRSALPVTLGATVLKGARLARGSVPTELYPAMAAGAAGAFLSAAASLPVARRAPPLRALGVYRIALGALCWRKARTEPRVDRRTRFPLFRRPRPPGTSAPSRGSSRTCARSSRSAP